MPKNASSQHLNKRELSTTKRARTFLQFGLAIDVERTLRPKCKFLRDVPFAIPALLQILDSPLRANELNHAKRGGSDGLQHIDIDTGYPQPMRLFPKLLEIPRHDLRTGLSSQKIPLASLDA